MRDRAWLRTFLALDARARETVLPRDIERQEDTVLRALELLETQPGVVLADEVGMGKTYEALGVVAARLHEQSDARALILTPGPDLNTKWVKELRGFCDPYWPMYRGFSGAFAAATTLAELVTVAADKRVVVAPVNIFAGSRSSADQAYLLALWAESKGLAGNQIAAVLGRYRGGTNRVRPEEERFLDVADWSMVKPHVKEVLRAHRESGDGSLDALFKDYGYDAFNESKVVDRALADLRFRLVGRLLPMFDLLVVDEAHKLKNADSVRAAGVRVAFDRRFEKGLFLTATPFQLTVNELSEVFALFGRARTAPADLDQTARRLLDDVREYTTAYGDLERVWSLVDEAQALDFAQWFAADPDLTKEPDDPTLRVVVACGRKLLTLKRNRIEPGFRAWMIRSLREDKRVYRRTHKKRLRPQGGGGVPFMLYERFIAELFRSKAPTHKAAVQINMVSSYGAAREGALLSDDVKIGLGEEPEAYRKLLQRVVGRLRDERGGHPKVAHVVRAALAAAERGEKTLVFCARVETLHELKRDIEAEWNERMVTQWSRLFPGATEEDIFDRAEDGTRVRGRHSRLQDRFQRGQDALYLALRERYVGTLLEATDFAHENLTAITTRANEILAKQRVIKAHAERVDWSLIKRCVEQATALLLRDAGRDLDVDKDAMRRLTDPSFVALGYDLEADDLESASSGTRTPEWSISEDQVELVVPHVHLWSLLKSPLMALSAALRVRAVERLARYLVSRYVPFLPELLAFAREQGIDIDEIQARELIPVIDRFWTTQAGRPWCDLLRRFLLYAGHLPEEHRKDVVDDALKAGAIVRHTVDGESRERLREAFNTPLYPMILVANEVMQEGLDLHHHCRHVVHHDLAWNPAQLEQRVGRVDRLGSLVPRLRAKDPATTLDITLPLVANTIDERLERTVRIRERWLEFLLGASPRLKEYGLADDPPQPLPAPFADALRIELGPQEPPKPSTLTGGQ